MPHPPTVNVTYNIAGWQTSFNSAMLARRYIRIRIKGAQASQVKGKVESFTVIKLPVSPIPVPFPKAAATTFLSGLPTLLALVLQAMTMYGYNSVKASFDANGSGTGNDELFLDLS